MLLRRAGLLVFAGIWGLFAALAATAVTTFFLSLMPAGTGRAAAGLLLGTAVELLRAAVMGFVFWSGTNDSWKKAGAWVFAAGALVNAVPLLRSGSPILIAALTGAWAAGSFLGCWYGERTDDDPRADHVRAFLFSIYPFRLPR